MKIIGHKNTLAFLSKGIESDRLNPSLVFSGPDGVGKRTVALQVAAYYCCEKNPQSLVDRACACAGCLKVQSGNHPDVLLINKTMQAFLIREKPETQTAIKIDTLRHADKFLHLKPSEARRRICIVEDADKMSEEAANSFLKVLEEPPHSALIILLSVNEKNMLATILSRCSVLKFNPVPVVDLARWLEENHGLSATESRRAAELSQGSFAKALLMIGEQETLDMAATPVDEFFAWLGESGWKDGRARAAKVLGVLIEAAREKLSEGDLAQQEKLQHLFTARRQLDRHVPSRLLLENVFVKCAPVFKGKP